MKWYRAKLSERFFGGVYQKIQISLPYHVYVFPHLSPDILFPNFKRTGSSPDQNLVPLLLFYVQPNPNDQYTHPFFHLLFFYRAFRVQNLSNNLHHCV